VFTRYAKRNLEEKKKKELGRRGGIEPDFGEKGGEFFSLLRRRRAGTGRGAKTTIGTTLRLHTGNSRGGRVGKFGKMW